jgi:ribonuclease E
MKRMLFNATYQEELRVACVDGQKLLNFDIETASKTQKKGNIYCGVITRVEQSLEACFIDYGTGKQGFLPFKEIHLTNNSTKSKDSCKILEGNKVIVQVEKDERGNKGAALTTFVSLPGRYLVLMPNSGKSGGISRRIDGEEREELKQLLSQLSLPSNMSVIARTAALGRMQEELQWDLNYLLKLWDAIINATQSHEKALIYQESNLVIRSIRDHFAPDISEILIDEESVYNEARNFMSSIMPNFVNKIKYYHDDIQLFSRFQIEHQIEAAYSRTVNLPSGGAIVIDHTEALTAIDVNSAKANKGADIETTALATNLEAAEEISRQIRLRDLGGLIVVDFIDMENYKNQRDVENYFKEQLSLDRARIQMGKLSKFGLLELSRQRLKNSLEESTTISCPRCTGIGVIRGTESIAVHILRIIQEEAVKSIQYASALHVQLPVDVATYLLNERRDDVAKLEARIKIKILLIPNQNLESPNYKIKKINHDVAELFNKKMSYNLVDSFEEQLNQYIVDNNKKLSTNQEKAAVGNIVPNQPAPMINKSILSKFIGTIYKKITNIFQDNNKKYSNKNNRNPNKGAIQTKKISPQGIKNKNNAESIKQNLKPNLKAIVNSNITNSNNTNNNNLESDKNINNSKSIYTNKNTIKKNVINNNVSNSVNKVSSIKTNLNININDMPNINKEIKLINKSSNTNIIKNIENKISPTVYESEELKKQIEKTMKNSIKGNQNIKDSSTIKLKTNHNKLDIEMIMTNFELYKNRKIPEIKSNKLIRYNDIIKADKIVNNQISYVMVETKKNNS